MTRLPPDALVLDIGDRVGALVLYTPDEALGAEIEISRCGDPHRTHTIIRPRHAGGRTVAAGVYPALDEGRYEVWGLSGAAIGTVTVQGGRVAELAVDSVI